MFTVSSMARALPALLLPSVLAGAAAATFDPVSPRSGIAAARQLEPQNPIDDDWYADPDAINFDGTVWVYATISIAFDNQSWFDALSSTDLATWTKHSHVFEAASSEWAEDAFWAPCTVERNGKYYLYYTANNPVADEKINGIGVAVADTPEGPFVDLIDRPMIDTMINGADAMDQQVFIDDDDSMYFVWGGSHVNIAPLEEDMYTLGSWANGSSEPVEITPDEGFGEGSYLMKHDGMYYFMWSEDGYGTPDYRVAYAMSESITGPFERIGLILSKDDVVADGPGHHSIFEMGGQHYIAYHRRIIGDDVADNRVLAVDEFFFNEDGTIRPVVMT